MNNESGTPDIWKTMEKLEDFAEVNIVDTDFGFGIKIGFTLKGFGFGEVAFGKNKSQPGWFADTECMSEKTVAKIIRLAADDLAKKLIEHDHKDRGK